MICVKANKPTIVNGVNLTNDEQIIDRPYVISMEDQLLSDIASFYGNLDEVRSLFYKFCQTRSFILCFKVEILQFSMYPCWRNLSLWQSNKSKQVRLYYGFMEGYNSWLKEHRCYRNHKQGIRYQLSNDIEIIVYRKDGFFDINDLLDLVDEPEQQDLLYDRFVNCKSVATIGKEHGVTKQAISHRLKLIFQGMRKKLEIKYGCRNSNVD